MNFLLPLFVAALLFRRWFLDRGTNARSGNISKKLQVSNIFLTRFLINDQPDIGMIWVHLGCIAKAGMLGLINIVVKRGSYKFVTRETVYTKQKNK